MHHRIVHHHLAHPGSDLPVDPRLLLRDDLLLCLLEDRREPLRRVCVEVHSRRGRVAIEPGLLGHLLGVFLHQIRDLLRCGGRVEGICHLEQTCRRRLQHAEGGHGAVAIVQNLGGFVPRLQLLWLGGVHLPLAHVVGPQVLAGIRHPPLLRLGHSLECRAEICLVYLQRVQLLARVHVRHALNARDGRQVPIWQGLARRGRRELVNVALYPVLCRLGRPRREGGEVLWVPGVGGRFPLAGAPAVLTRGAFLADAGDGVVVVLL
mmetsp:Transcript_25863/g.58777  ORF Transcript_25863/g.58777 Transcript_25863/m.58777 type:complete len:264 (-) Transcript_25863:774-1565(-)